MSNVRRVSRVLLDSEGQGHSSSTTRPTTANNRTHQLNVTHDVITSPKRKQQFGDTLVREDFDSSPWKRGRKTAESSSRTDNNLSDILGSSLNSRKRVKNDATHKSRENISKALHQFYSKSRDRVELSDSPAVFPSFQASFPASRRSRSESSSSCSRSAGLVVGRARRRRSASSQTAARQFATSSRQSVVEAAGDVGKATEGPGLGGVRLEQIQTQRRAGVADRRAELTVFVTPIIGLQLQHKQQSASNVFQAMDGHNVVHRLTKVETLLIAAARGRTRQVQQLLLEGVPLQTDQDGCTALHHAAVNGNTDIVSMLATYNSCLLEIKDKSGQTALHHAAVRGHVETATTLLQLGSRPDRRCTDQLSNTALHLAAFHGFSQTVQQLIVHHANVQLTNTDGSTALHLAAQNGHNETTRLLLFAGCQPSIKNHYGDTALHTAARYGHAGVTGILINARCLVNLQNTNGDTALHISAALKRRKITRLLLDSGINTNIKNKQTERAVDVAQRKEHTEILELLAPKASKNKRRSLGGQVKVTSVEVLSSPPSTEKKKNKLLLFFTRKKKSKNVEDIELTSPTTSPQVQSPVEYQPLYNNGASYQLTRTNGVEYQPVYTTNNEGVDPLSLLRDFRSHLHNQVSVTNGNESAGDVTSSRMHASMYYINHSAAAAVDTVRDVNRDTITDQQHQATVDRVWLRHSELNTTGSGRDLNTTRHHGPYNNGLMCRTDLTSKKMNGTGSGQGSRCGPDGDEMGKLHRCRSDDTLSTVSAAESHCHRVGRHISTVTTANNDVVAAAVAAASDASDAVWTKLSTNGHNNSSTLSADCEVEV